jgi:hypothetical protein
MPRSRALSLNAPRSSKASTLRRIGRIERSHPRRVAGVGQLIIAAEDGSLVLLNASPSAHVELGRIVALDGKTWNHPIVANNCVFARNGASAVRLELAR